MNDVFLKWTSCTLSYFESNISLSWFKAFMSTKKTDNWANLDLKKKKFWLERRDWRHLKMLRLTTVHCQILSLPKIVTPYHRSSPHVAKVNQYLSYLHSFLHFDAYLSTLFRTSILFSASSNLSNQSVHTKSYLSIIPPQLFQKDKRSKRRWWDSKDIQTTSNKLQSSKKGGGGGGACFDLFNSMIYRSRWSVDLRWMIEHWCYIHPLIILFHFGIHLFFPFPLLVYLLYVVCIHNLCAIN